MVFAQPDSPAFMLGAFDFAAAVLQNEAPVEAAFSLKALVEGLGGRVECRGGHHSFGELARMHLQAVVFLGLQQLDIAGGLHHLDGLVGQLAQLLCFPGLFAKLVGDVTDLVDNPLGHGRFLTPVMG